ncbi:MAG: polyprenyl synthetase family protein [Planctomycetota bacterium]
MPGLRRACRRDTRGNMNGILDRARDIVDTALQSVLPPTTHAPERLHTAMRYAVLAGGKRVRPALVLASGLAAAGDTPATERSCVPAMAAVELLHTYTLVHDDLPAMDDDALRRGRPTCHVAFDEATAILVGDALLTLAMGTCAACSATAVRCLAAAAGSLGVVGGQQEDLDAEHGRGAADDDAARLERIHARKTAALLEASCELGAIAVDADDALRTGLAAYGRAMGLAFQITDDILDCTTVAATLGKTPGKDAQAGKLTYVSLHGIDAARARARALHDEATSLLADLDLAGTELARLGRYIIERNH